MSVQSWNIVFKFYAILLSQAPMNPLPGCVHSLFTGLCLPFLTGIVPHLPIFQGSFPAPAPLTSA